MPKKEYATYNEQFAYEEGKKEAEEQVEKLRMKLSKAGKHISETKREIEYLKGEVGALNAFGVPQEIVNLRAEVELFKKGLASYKEQLRESQNETLAQIELKNCLQKELDRYILDNQRLTKEIGHLESEPELNIYKLYTPKEYLEMARILGKHGIITKRQFVKIKKQTEKLAKRWQTKEYQELMKKVQEIGDGNE